MGFVHLHNHTKHSLLDGACHIDKMVDKAVEYGMPALAITDHGNMYGAIEFYKACSAKNIKPILGVEAYIAPTYLDYKKPIDGEPSGGHHLVLLATNNTGYHNLLKLISVAHTEGFYYRPRIDNHILREHCSGLIALTACVKGRVPDYILKDRYEEATKHLSWLMDTFGKENVFVEIQNHALDMENIVRPRLVELAQTMGVGLVATNDIHYLERAHADAHDILLCIQTRKLESDIDRMKYGTNHLYFKSQAEMVQLFGQYQGAIDNTLSIAERCDVKIELGNIKLPPFPTPNGETQSEYLAYLAKEGAKRRFGNPSQEIIKQIEFELGVIDKMGFSGYFLIVSDFINYAKSNGIPVGPGRGSVAGSMVAYVIGITEVDPMKYNLFFERFLNPDRISMPDIDVDFADTDRAKVIEYVSQKYGASQVSQIITFGTLQARNTIRDVGRVLGYDLGEIDKLAKAIPQKFGLEDAEEIIEIAHYKKSRLWETARVLEGLHRHASTHAAGIVIAPSPVIEHAPLSLGKDGEIITQYDMGSLESIGLLKMDFLGLKTLSVIRDTINMKYPNGGFDINAIPLDDKDTYKIFQDGDTIGIFQFESPGMRKYLKRLHPEHIDDLSAMNALYRPGPLEGGVVDQFIDCRHGEQEIHYMHSDLEPILSPTYGFIVYQEQAMKIAAVIAGFTLAEADTLRKAMGKKLPEVMAQQKTKFIEGAVTKGYDRKLGEDLFDLIDKFSGYGFNRAHSVSYALIAYQTAYLKAHFPIEFMTALLTSETGDQERVMQILQECKKMGIKILPPDINISGKHFTPDGDSIRFGFSAIKGLGDDIAGAISKLRPYDGIFDLALRLDKKLYSSTKLRSMIDAGCFDSFGSRKAHDLVLEKASQCGRVYQDMQNFALLFEPEVPDVTNTTEFDIKELLMRERDALGYYITGHPLDNADVFVGARTIRSLLSEFNPETEYEIVAVCTRLDVRTTKKTKLKMATLQVEDKSGLLEVLVFPKLYSMAGELLKVGEVYSIVGRMNDEDGEVRMFASFINRKTVTYCQ